MPDTKINLEIPSHLLTKVEGIDFSLIKDKKIVGLLGYSKSGKDTVADFLVSNYGYKKIKFADILKQMLNNHFKELVVEDLKNKKVSISFSEIDFFVEEDRVLKQKLRPYMIWLGETLKQKNGMQFFVNKTLQGIGDAKKIVIADIRRENELDLFRGNNFTSKTLYQSYGLANALNDDIIRLHEKNKVNYETNLFFVNQLNLDDDDILTKNTILSAFKEWLIEDNINIDSRIPIDNIYRKKYMENVCSMLCHKHNL